MKLPALGVEDVTFTVVANFPLAGVLQAGVTTTDEFPPASFTWTTTAWSDVESQAPNGDHLRPFVLEFAGSAVASPPDGSLKLAGGVNYLWVQLSQDTEIIIRRAGRITAM